MSTADQWTRFSDEQWARLEDIVDRAGGNLGLMRRGRKGFERAVSNTMDLCHESEDINAAEESLWRESSHARRAIADLRVAYSKLPEWFKGSLSELYRDMPPAEYLRSLEVALTGVKPIRRNKNFLRNAMWSTFIEFWHMFLDLDLGTGNPSLVVHFLMEASKTTCDRDHVSAEAARAHVKTRKAGLKLMAERDKVLICEDPYAVLSRERTRARFVDPTA